MGQLNGTMKLFMSTHEEYQSLVTNEEQNADSEWYDQFDENVFSFKHKTVKRLKEAELNKSRMSYKSGSSRRCKFGSSKSSSKSGNSRVSKLSTEKRGIEENIRLAEVIAEAKKC